MPLGSSTSSRRRGLPLLLVSRFVKSRLRPSLPTGLSDSKMTSAVLLLRVVFLLVLLSWSNPRRLEEGLLLLRDTSGISSSVSGFSAVENRRALFVPGTRAEASETLFVTGLRVEASETSSLSRDARWRRLFFSGSCPRRRDGWGALPPSRRWRSGLALPCELPFDQSSLCPSMISSKSSGGLCDRPPFLGLSERVVSTLSRRWTGLAVFVVVALLPVDDELSLGSCELRARLLWFLATRWNSSWLRNCRYTVLS